MRWWILLVILIVLISSCTSRPVAPTRASRRAIDTIYQQQVLQLQPNMDSVCAHLRDSLYAVAVDSILILRKGEIEALIK